MTASSSMLTTSGSTASPTSGQENATGASEALETLAIVHQVLGKNQDIIDANTRHVLTIIFWFVLQIPTTALGIGTNIVTIVIFTQSGLKDSVSVAFTALSVSDLGYSTFFFIIRTNALLQHMFHVQSRMNLSWLSYYLSLYGLFFQDLSILITVFIAVQKCCCVAIPYLFKDVFTLARTVVILACMGVAMTTAYVPMFAGLKFTVVANPSNANATVVIGVRHPLFFRGMTFWRIFNKLVLPASSQCICLVCLVVMMICLKKSAKFRTLSTGGDKGDASDSKLGHREKRALAAVALVLVIFIVTTIPSSLLHYWQLLATSFFADPRYQTIRRLLTNCQNIPIHVSASVNIFVYLKYNSKFKDTASVLFSQCLCCAANGRSRRSKDEKEKEDV